MQKRKVTGTMQIKTLTIFLLTEHRDPRVLREVWRELVVCPQQPEVSPGTGHVVAGTPVSPDNVSTIWPPPHTVCGVQPPSQPPCTVMDKPGGRGQGLLSEHWLKLLRLAENTHRSSLKVGEQHTGISRKIVKAASSGTEHWIIIVNWLSMLVQCWFSIDSELNWILCPLGSDFFFQIQVCLNVFQAG